MYDIVALGELLIDFAPIGHRQFQANAGGAPANVLAAASRLGSKTAFIGKVGEDDFGTLLKKDLQKEQIDVTGLLSTSEAATTLAFVHLDNQGNRSFTFVRKPGADLLLSKEEIDYPLIDQAKIFHFGSVSMTHSPAREATLEGAKYAKSKGIITSFDPNLRPLLWDDIDEAKEIILSAVPYSDILKISEEEMEFLTGISDLEKGSAQLLHMGPKLIFVTLGPKGCFYRTANNAGTIPTYDVNVVDTTGSGDAFLGGVLHQLLQYDKQAVFSLNKEQIEKIVDFGNCTGSLTATKKGAIATMPTWPEIEECLQSVPKLIL